jgi:hypothetical protein
MNSTCADLDEEEHLQRLQAQGFYGEEITSQQLVLVLAQEGTPGTALPSSLGSRRNMLTFQDISNSRAPNAIAQFV